MKVAVVGAGSNYTPTLVKEIVDRNSNLDCDEIAMYDPDPSRLEAVVGMSRRLSEGSNIAIKTYSGLEDLVADATFITTSVRVAGLQGRLKDAQVANSVGLIGQETVGAGGLAFALRSVPAMQNLADVVKKVAPDAWIINGTNPDGLVTRALLQRGHDRSVGLCDIPYHMQLFFSEWFKVDRRDIELEGTGLNHLTWYDHIYVNGKDRTEEFWAGGGASAYQPPAANIPKIKMPVEFLTYLKLFPSPYLNYYYFPQQILEDQLHGVKLRAQVTMEIESKLFEAYRDQSVTTIPAIMAQRGGARFCEVIIDLVSDMLAGHGRQIANVKNGDAVPELPPESVIEVPCDVSHNHLSPIHRTPMPLSIKGLIESVDAYEELVLRGVTEANRDLILNAMLTHPLIGDLKRANALLEKLVAAYPEELAYLR